MAIGYLFSVTLVALGTLLALAPLRRPRILGRASFLAGMVVNELPSIAFIWLLAATLLAFGQGDLDSPGDLAVAGVAVVTMVGLVFIARRGLRAAPAVEQALDEGLGDGWRGSIDAAIAARTPRRPPLARMLLFPFPWLSRPGAVERVRNISYGDAGRRNLLDLYRHRSHPTGAPVLVYTHAGGYFSGNKVRDARPLIHRLANQGWVCISANYRLRPQATFPDHLIDLKKVIAWVREHGGEYGADPATLFVAGSSAGGHMTSLAALTPNDPAFQPGFEDADTSVTGAISLFGYLGNYYGQGPESSPRSHVRADAPPFFVAQGDSDTYSPQFVDIARDFVGKLRSASANPVVYAELPGGQHSFDLFHSIRFEAVVDGIESFAARVRSR